MRADEHERIGLVLEKIGVTGGRGAPFTLINVIARLNAGWLCVQADIDRAGLSALPPLSDNPYTILISLVWLDVGRYGQL